MSSDKLRPAAFLDRDGTIIVERDYLANPAQVQLTDAAAAGLKLLQQAGYQLVIVTNQSGIARGLYQVSDFEAVQQRLTDLLAKEGVTLAGVFYCPHHPDFTGPCDCRKPGSGMYRAAAGNLQLDPAASLYIGDRLKDVLPAQELGGRGVLVRTGYGRTEEQTAPAWVIRVDNLLEAARWALQEVR